MRIPSEQQFMHDWVISQVEQKYSSLYKEIRTNPGEEQLNEFEGFFPDVILGSYGQVVQIIEVETEATIDEKRSEYWKDLSALSAQMILLVPAKSKTHVTDICWKCGLAGKVKIGIFEVSIRV
ncbi:MAG: hypothetical protein OXC97_05000 [Candidatus Dadabacteria bacterium]|nr:hypothetical protein [Candidatus Dadabacteria bacterium]